MSGVGLMSTGFNNPIGPIPRNGHRATLFASEVAHQTYMVKHSDNPFFLIQTTAHYPPVALFIFDGSTK